MKPVRAEKLTRIPGASRPERNSHPMLERISLQLPESHPEFHLPLLGLLSPLGKSARRRLDFEASDPAFLPLLSLDFASSDPTSEVIFSRPGRTTRVPIENITGRKKKNPLPYRHLAVAETSRRISAAGWSIRCVDHVGFNLPWFGPDLHPRIRELRAELAGSCLYHTYPGGEPWDFILPGTADEIAGSEPVDYSIRRRPKFELVSFDGASTPLIQIDLHLNARFDDFSRLFPEALADLGMNNIWIYLENPYSIDVCLVINGESPGDWCGHFRGCRLRG
jgi:hypothetical protein